MSQQDMSWCQLDARRQIIGKIYSSLKQSGTQSLQNCAVIENQIFLKSKTKEEYYKYTAGAITVLRSKVKVPSATNAPSNMQMPVSNKNGMVRMPVAPPIPVRNNLWANEQMRQISVRNTGTIRHPTSVQLKPNIFTQIIRSNSVPNYGMITSLQPPMHIPQNQQSVVMQTNRNIRLAGIAQNKIRMPVQTPVQNAIHTANIRQHVPQNKVRIMMKNNQQHQYKPALRMTSDNGNSAIRNSVNNTLNINNVLLRNITPLNKPNTTNILIPNKQNKEVKPVESKQKEDVVLNKSNEKLEINVLPKIATISIKQIKQPTAMAIKVDNTKTIHEAQAQAQAQAHIKKDAARNSVLIPQEMLDKYSYNLSEDTQTIEFSLPSPNTIPEDIDFQPFLDVVSSQLNKPNINKTLKRTFLPIVHEFRDVSLKVPLPAKRQCTEHLEDSIDFNILVGEVHQINIDGRFYVFIKTGNDLVRSLTLHCDMKDKHLPDVPPIVINVPENYPTSSPSCTMSEDAYSGTDFLTDIKEGFQDRITKLTSCFTVSHLLDTWEMSVRQAWGEILKAPDALAMQFGF